MPWKSLGNIRKSITGFIDVTRSKFLICAWILSFSCSVRAQGVATNEAERSAVEMLVDFVTLPVQLPDEYACVLRENQISYTSGTELDTVYLFCEDRRRAFSSRFSATGSVGQNATTDGESRRWVQYLRTPTHRAQRQGGAAFGRYAGEVLEDVKMDPEESRILRFPSGHDFVFFRPIAPDGDRRQGVTHTSGYGKMLLDALDLMGAKELDDGTIQSDWARKLWRVQITFDPKQGNCPTKIIHYRDLDIEKPGQIVCVHIIDWVKWELEAKRSLWIPGHYRFRHSLPDYNTDYEIEGYLKWADTTKKSVMPKLFQDRDNDWREMIQERFNEDWSIRFAAWVDNNRVRGSIPVVVE